MAAARATLSAVSKTTATIKVKKSENHARKMATGLTVGSSVSEGKQEREREREREREKRHTVVNLTIHRRTPTSSQNLLNHLLRQLERPTNARTTASRVAKNGWDHCCQRTMQQKKWENAWIRRVFVDSIRRREMKGDGEEAGRSRGRM